MDTTKKTNLFSKLGATLKEAVRMFLVTLKKNPNLIPLSMLVVSFLVYSLNLTHVSNTTATVQGKGMGLCEFVIMLASLLSMIAMLNAFPKRQKPNYPIVALIIVLIVVVIVMDLIYNNCIVQAIVMYGDKIKPEQMAEYYLTYEIISINALLMGVTGVTVILEPLFAKLLKKIKTTVEIEETHVDNIDLSEDE